LISRPKRPPRCLYSHPKTVFGGKESAEKGINFEKEINILLNPKLT